MKTLLRSTLEASKLLSALLLAWTGCHSPVVEPPPGEPTGCEETGTCANLGASHCWRVHVWDVWQFGTDQDDMGVAVGTDEECNIYIAGNTRGRFVPGPGMNVTVTEAGAAQDVFAVRLPPIMSPEPGEPPPPLPDVKIIQLGSTGEDSVKDIAIGPDRTTYLVGATAGKMPGASAAGQGFNDIFATKLRSTGTREWTQQYGSPEEDSALAVALRPEGNGLNAYIAGASQADVYEGFQITLDKLGPDGSIAARKMYGTYEHDRAEGLALDLSGNIFIVGSTMGDYSPDSHLGSTDVIVTKIAQQNLDEEEWKSQVATSDIDAALDVVVDNSGNLYVLAVSFSDLEQGMSENDGLQNSFLLKYNVGGSRPEWIKRIGVKSKYSRATGMTLDSEGRVYVAGFTMGTMQEGKPNAGGRDAFVARYDAQGEMDWARQIGTPGNDEASDVVVTPGNDVVITGFTTGDLWGMGSQGRQDAFIARFSLTSQQ